MTPEEAWRILDEIKDPEIPVVSIVEMGMLRHVEIEDQTVTVTIAPTFVGCPAIQVIQEHVTRSLEEAGAETVNVRFTYSPPWSSDAITPEARKKLKDFGLSPPQMHQGLIEIALLDPAACPYCDSTNTSMRNSFGPTLCRSIHYCNNCQQPFEAFKPL